MIQFTLMLEQLRAQEISTSDYFKNYIPIIGALSPSDPRFLMAGSVVSEIIENKITAWQKQKFDPLIADSVLLSFLGHQGGQHLPPFEEFGDYAEYLPHEIRFIPEKRLIFENKMTALVIWTILHRIQTTPSSDLESLATSLTCLQLVSNNLRASESQYRLNERPDWAMQAYVSDSRRESRKAIEYRFAFHDHSFPFVYFDDLSSEYGNEYPFLRDNITELFAHHFDSWYYHGVESGKPLPPNLLGAFFGILEKNHSDYLSNYLDLDKTKPEQKFARKYFEGLLAVAKLQKEGKHNGILYLSDHLERILRETGNWPQNGTVWGENKWEEILLLQTDTSRLFDFLSPDERVRELVGRYDYRALVDILKTAAPETLRVLALGFGKLGAASYEFWRMLSLMGINAQIIPADINAPQIDIDPDKIGVMEYTRGLEGTVLSEGKPKIATTRGWSREEITALLN